MATYPSALLDDIRAGVDIVDLVGRFVNLKKAGVNWKGLCPFHAEKTPSFMVNPKKGIFHCFGCGVGGDVFGFLMRQDRLSFPEAVRALARQAGVSLPDDRSGGTGDSGREELLRVMELASQFYREMLGNPAGERAREYLERRGIDPEVARRFGLGYAPDAWEALTGFMRTEHVTDEPLVTAGLAIARDTRAGVYDRFRGRLMFPIHDAQGRVVAFGGRAFGDEQPKYLNSPETPLYTKGNLLYAVDLARDTMRERRRALLVEGYVDCLMAHQHGFTETVAALGTAFTPAQLRLLHRYTSEVVTFFDADAAGQKAAERAEELLEPTDAGATWGVNRSGSFDSSGALKVKVALLPAGHDPDTFLRESGAPAFEERIGAARSLLAYALDRAIGDTTSGARARTHGFARAALLLAKVNDAEEAAMLSREAAVKLGVDPTQLWIESQRLQAALRRPTTPAVAASPRPGPAVPDRDLVTLLLRALDGRQALLPMIEDADIEHEPLRAIVEALRRRPDATAESLMVELADESARGLLASLLVEEREPGDDQASIAQFQARLERKARLKRMRALARTIAETQAAPGGDSHLDDELRSLEQDSRHVHLRALGSRITGPHGSEGVHTHE